jgi:hypothetical protein
VAFGNIATLLFSAVAIYVDTESMRDVFDNGKGQFSE